MANRIGNYELIAELGSGAMGKVYRARDTRLDREVALKVLWPQLTVQPTAVARFEREARAAARLRHPNVVAVYEVGTIAEYHYLAMEYMDGGSLREMLTQPLPVEKALHYFKQILAGLGVAHEMGVIHRDLKPGNILRDAATDTIKLADFGLARIIEEEISLTQTGEMLGTIEYMAPELSRGEGAGRQSDLYAAGVALYRMLTGRFPFAGATPVAILRAHKCGIYPAATTIIDGLAPQADGLLARLLACEPSNRYTDCQSVFADIERWEKGEAITLLFAVVSAPLEHEIERHRVSGWKRAWARVAMWIRYQWIEVFNRTELTEVRMRDELSAAELEMGNARQRLEEATLLQNRVRARVDEARVAMRECEKAAKRAQRDGDESQMRLYLADHLEAKERVDDLDKEATEREQAVALLRQEYELRAAPIVELRHDADLLIARRRRVKMELSILGVLPAGGRRIGERLIALGKLLIIPSVGIVCLYQLTAVDTQGDHVLTSLLRNVEHANVPLDTHSEQIFHSTSGNISRDDLDKLLQQLAIYEPFDGSNKASGDTMISTYVEGKIGQAISISPVQQAAYEVWPDFLKEGTVMAWVRPHNGEGLAWFWAYNYGSPSVYYCSYANNGLAMDFGTTIYPALLQQMKNDVWYHLTQSWGPNGHRAYLNGVLKNYEMRFRSGIRDRSTPQPYPLLFSHQIALGDFVLTRVLGRAGSDFDEFAVFKKQLTDDEAYYFANKTRALPE